MLNITVGTQSISPLMWSIESGALDAARAMLFDLLTIRADRDRYYYGADELFTRHPEIITFMCQEAPLLVPNVLDGLVWRSRLTEKGTRRVNVYFKHLLLDENGGFHGALNAVAELRDPKLSCHPVLVLMSDTLWGGICYRTFLAGKAWLIFTLLMFITSQSILRSFAWQTQYQGARYVVFAFRLFIYSFALGELVLAHIRKSVKAFREGATTRLGCLVIPSRYLEDWQEAVSISLIIFLILMLSQSPDFYCFPYHSENFAGAGFLTEVCPEENLDLKRYGVYSMIATFLYFIRLIDLTVLSNRVCAYILMCGHVIPEVGLFLFSLTVIIFAFSCGTATLAQTTAQYGTIPTSALSFLEISMTMFDPRYYDPLNAEDGWVYALNVLFIIVIFIYLLNLLIAQINCSFQAISLDMVGFARISRINIICTTVPLISPDRWTRWVATLGLDNKLEFNEGDVGLAGGIQVKEPASANPTTIDSIRRFGGSTSIMQPWPEESAEAEDGETARLDRMEKLMQRIAKAAAGSSKGGKKGAGSSSGGGGGSGAEGGEHSEGGEAEAEAEAGSE